MMLDDGTIRRIKAFADNDSLGWVDVHGDIWNLLHAYKITMQERDRLREAAKELLLVLPLLIGGDREELDAAIDNMEQALSTSSGDK